MRDERADARRYHLAGDAIQRDGAEFHAVAVDLELTAQPNRSAIKSIEGDKVVEAVTADRCDGPGSVAELEVGPARTIGSSDPVCS